MTSLTYSLTYKRSLPNYESVQVFYSISDEVRENETIEVARERVESKVDQWVNDKIAEIDGETE